MVGLAIKEVIKNGNPLVGNLLLEWKANLSSDWKFKTVLCHLLDNFG